MPICVYAGCDAGCYAIADDSNSRCQVPYAGIKISNCVQHAVNSVACFFYWSLVDLGVCCPLSGEGVQQLAAALQATLQQLRSNGSGLMQDKNYQQAQLQPVDYQHESRQDPGGGYEAGSISATVSAALAGFSASSQQQQQQTMQESNAPVLAGDSEGQGHGDYGDGEDELAEDDFEYEEEDEDYEDEMLEDEYEVLENDDLGGSSSSSSRQEQSDEAEPPAPLAADDPDRWLFDLSEDELLALADEG
jgi:hypothetical protein